MPRRKYGHMVGACPPTPIEKCRACRLGYPCPVHDKKDRPDYEDLAKKKRRRKNAGKAGRRWAARKQNKKKKKRSGKYQDE